MSNRHGVTHEFFRIRRQAMIVHWRSHTHGVVTFVGDGVVYADCKECLTTMKLPHDGAARFATSYEMGYRS